MGASTSTSRDQVSEEEREAEALAGSTGALPMLQKAFTLLSDPQTKLIPVHSLQRCFTINFENPVSEATTVPTYFPALLSQLPSSIVDLFFLVEKGGVSWLEFLRGYTKCCARIAVSVSLNYLFRVFGTAIFKTGLPAKLQFECDDDQGKMKGSLLPSDVRGLLWMCWLMSRDYRNVNFPKNKADHRLPGINHLVFSAVLSCVEVSADLNVWDHDISELDMQLPASKIHMWALKTVPNLADCLLQFVHARLCNSVTHEDNEQPSCSSGHDVASMMTSTHLLTHGRAWAISLTLRSTISEEILKACFSDGANESQLYRSSLHGKGLNRFWSNIEGYNGPLLLLIAASIGDALDGNANARSWIIGALTFQGFENRDTFYGSSGILYAICPVFHAFFSSGKEKNFVYSHLHPTGKLYETHPKPVGIAFGGSSGNERIFIDEDFARVTVRHHAVDKTYQPGSLFPNQGFLPFEATIMEIEVWGLGGRRAKEVQMSYKKRELLFTEQRRKVDLKTFSSWDDSPEKVMMDMVSDPIRVRREDR